MTSNTNIKRTILVCFHAEVIFLINYNIDLKPAPPPPPPPFRLAYIYPQSREYRKSKKNIFFRYAIVMHNIK